MSKFCVVNFQKNKRSSVKNLQKEANREFEKKENYKNEIDMNIENIYLIKTENWNKIIDELLNKYNIKERKNSVVLTTSVYGFSSEWEESLLEKYNGDVKKVEEDKLEYFEKCYEFERTRGVCINFVIHKDETGNWHAHGATVPLLYTDVTESVPQKDELGNILRYESGKSKGKVRYEQVPVIGEDGKRKEKVSLSAKEIFGNRKKMSDTQTLFYEQCGKPFGMERGECRIMDAPNTVKHLTEVEYKAKAINDTLNTRETQLNAIRDDLDKKQEKISEHEERALKFKQSALEEYVKAQDEYDKAYSYYQNLLNTPEGEEEDERDEYMKTLTLRNGLTVYDGFKAWKQQKIQEEMEEAKREKDRLEKAETRAKRLKDAERLMGTLSTDNSKDKYNGYGY